MITASRYPQLISSVLRDLSHHPPFRDGRSPRLNYLLASALLLLLLLLTLPSSSAYTQKPPGRVLPRLNPRRQRYIDDLYDPTAATTEEDDVNRTMPM